MSRLQGDLNRFIDSWNCHKLRTGKNLTPNQLFLLHSDDNGAEDFIDDDEYGVEDGQGNHAPLLNEDIVVEPTLCPFNDDQYENFSSRVSRLNLQDDESTFLDRVTLAFDVMEQILS